jgi:uncharacterized protein YndB with AHSA1/START domain
VRPEVARNEIFIAVPPTAVFEVLADPRTYAKWVVGSREVRAADESWPAPGSAFDHSVGKQPLVIKDDTSVVDSQPPVMLELRARARPLPTARIILHLESYARGTRVTMIEEPANRVLARVGGPLLQAAIRLRNRESLRRLKALAEGTVPRPSGALPPRERVNAA